MLAAVSSPRTSRVRYGLVRLPVVLPLVPRPAEEREALEGHLLAEVHEDVARIGWPPGEWCE
jgi:hypothetical protein